MKVTVHRPKRVRIEMLPLIDIVFLLLVFFIYAMLSMAVHRGLPVVLPRSATAKLETASMLSVTVKADGSIYVDEAPATLPSLAEALRHRQSAYKDAGVLLFADHEVAYQNLFRVLDTIRSAGIEKISLQAQQERP